MSAGEFGQERRVLPPEYHVFPCKAALFNLAQSGGLMRWWVWGCYVHVELSGLLLEILLGADAGMHMLSAGCWACRSSGKSWSACLQQWRPGGNG